MKVYGADICIDCRNFKHINQTRKLNLEFIDITENTDNLREFLYLRDTEAAFSEIRKRGGIGIPAFVYGEKVTLDINEAFLWIGQKPVEDDEIAETREMFDICDESGVPVGKTISREKAHEEGICHRTAHVWIVRKHAGKWEVLLQKRSIHKDSFPGCFDTSSAGHVPAGEEPLESALRELEEELGIKAKAEELYFAGQFRVGFEEYFHGKLFKDNEVANVFVYKEPIKIEKLSIQKEELESVGWFGYEDTLKACRSHDPAYCVPDGGLQLVGEYLEKLEEKFL